MCLHHLKIPFQLNSVHSLDTALLSLRTTKCNKDKLIFSIEIAGGQLVNVEYMPFQYKCTLSRDLNILFGAPNQVKETIKLHKVDKIEKIRQNTASETINAKFLR